MAKNFFEKVLETGVDLVGNVVSGAGKAIEGIVDAGATVVGEVGGLFDKDFKKGTEDFIKRDFTGEWIQNPFEEATKDSYLNNGWLGNTVENVSQGVGQLLPNVALTATGAGFLSMPMLFTRATGNSIEQSLNEGASLERSALYGVASGTVEMLTEKLSGRLFGNVSAVDRALGTEMVKKSLFKSAKTGFGRVLQNMTGEAIEEAVAEIASPFLKQIYKAESVSDAIMNPLKETFTKEHLMNVVESAIVGGLTSLAFQPVDGAITKISPSYANLKKLSDIQNQMIEYNTEASRLDRALSEGKVDVKSQEYKNALGELEKLRQDIIINSSQVQFEKGKLSKSNKPILKAQAQMENILNQNYSTTGKYVNGKLEFNKDVAINQINDSYNAGAYSATLKGREDELKFKPTNNELSAEARTAQGQIASLEKKFGRNINYVFSDNIGNNGKQERGVYSKGVFYLNANLTSKEIMQEVAIHEFTHSLEGTEAYNEYKKYVLKQLADNPELIKKLGVDTKKYGNTINSFKLNVFENYAKHNIKLNAEGIDSEVIAKFTSEYLFKDEKTINKLCSEELSLGQRILNWIKETISKVSGHSREEVQVRAFLKKAENLYSRAIKNAKPIQNNENLDNKDKNQYAINDKKKPRKQGRGGFYSQFRTRALSWGAKVAKGELLGLYDGDIYNIIIATGDDDVYNIYKTIPADNEQLISYYEGFIDDNNEKIERNAINVSRIIERIENYKGLGDSNSFNVTKRQANTDFSEVDKNEFTSNGERYSQEVSGNQQRKIKSYIYGEGYSLEGISKSDYNLVDVDKKGEFRDLLRELNKQIKADTSMISKENVDLRLGLFSCLAEQENKVFSKLIDINKAYEATLKAYNKDNHINTVQTFIKSLGYNGVVDGKDSIIYDLENKKKSSIPNFSASWSIEENKLNDSKEELINSTMSMETCKNMLIRTFNLVDPNQYEEKTMWKTADEWLKDVGTEEVALYIDNEYEISSKYFSKEKTPAVYNDEVSILDILESYLKGTLKGNDIKQKATRLDVSKGVGYSDNRFYSPKQIDDAKRKLAIANLKLTNQNRENVMQARADILVFAHNKGACELLGLSQAELNKKLLSWSHYTARARDISKEINKDVALENKWVGLENSSYLLASTISEKDMASLVKEIKGHSSEYERNYITTVMLALDTHIDYSHLTFEFGANFDSFIRGTVLGQYSESSKKITIKRGTNLNTVAHEIGHAIDYQWYRDVWGEKKEGLSLSMTPINYELLPQETAQWVKNFKVFIDNITDSGDIGNEYKMSADETFARFVARFVEWTKTVATGRVYRTEKPYYQDKFTTAQYYEFVKILQEKAKLDSVRNKNISSSGDIRFSIDDDFIDSIDDYVDKFLDMLSPDEFMELVKEEIGKPIKIETSISKQERRETYIEKLYEEGKLNQLITKIAKANPQMYEYFKETKMNMKYNPLFKSKEDEFVVMFHGTPNNYFNVFNSSRMGEHGTVMGEGFYFTASLEYAKDYKQNYGRVIATLLDIKKPLSRNKITITNAELKKFIKDVLVKNKKNYLEDYGNDIDYAVEYWTKRYDNDVELIQAFHDNSLMDWDDFYGQLRDSIGYDGIIAWNKAEGTQAIVFNSNQIKDVFNYKPTKSDDMRFAIDENIDADVKREFGTTTRWTKTGYLMTDGSQLDLSGKKQGGMPNGRNVDHREIFDIYDDADDYGTDAMIQFMAKGHIRVSPEFPGINLQIEPNDIQYKKLKALIEDLGYRKGCFMIDFDDKYGDTVESLEYDDNFTANKIIDDIRYYYKNGEVPQKSDLSQFRYSIDDVDNNLNNDYTENNIPGTIQDAIVKYILKSEKNKIDVINDSIKSTKERLKKMDLSDNLKKILNERLDKLYEERRIRQNGLESFTSNVEKSNIHTTSSSKERIYNLGDLQGQRFRDYDESYTRRIQEVLSEELGFNEKENSDILGLYSVSIKNAGLYRNYDIDGFKIDIINRDAQVKELNALVDENAEFGIRTWFYIDNVKQDLDEDTDMLGFYTNSRVFLRIDELNPDFVTCNRHEKIHHFQDNYKELYQEFKTDAEKAMTKVERANLISKYRVNYNKLYKILSKEEFEQRVENEVFAQLYAGNEKIKNQSLLNDAIENFENKLRQEFNVSHEIQYSISDDFDLDILQQDSPSDEGFFNAEKPGKSLNLSRTDAIKMRAKLKQNKVYSKEELNEIVSNTIKLMPEIRVTAKNRDMAVEMLFEKMNTQDINDKYKTAETIADFLINNAYFNNFDYAMYPEQADTFVELIKGQKFNLSYAVKQELMYVFDKKPGMSIYNSYYDKDGIIPEDLAEELNQYGAGIDLSNSEQQIFLDIYNLYKDSQKLIKDFNGQRNELAKNILDSEVIKADRKTLVDTILKAYDEGGNDTSFAKLKKNYQSIIGKIRDDLKDVQLYSKALVDFMVINKQAKEIVKNKYSSSVLNNPIVTDFLKTVAGAGNIKTVSKTARNRMRALRDVYNLSSENSIFKDIENSNQEEFEIFGVQGNAYDQTLAEMIEYLASGEGELSATDLNLLTKITQGLIHLYKTYDKTFKDGKYQETSELADKYIKSTNEHIETRNSVKSIKVLWKGKELLDPHAVLRNLDSYDSVYNKELGIMEDRGFFSEFYKDITDGEVKAKVAELELLDPFGKFFKEHKGFEKSLTKKKLTLELNRPTVTSATSHKFDKVKIDIPLGEAISIYLTSLRPQSNFYETTITLANKDKTQTNFKMNADDVSKMFNEFTAEEKEYIKLVQKFFNEKATKLKVDTDMKVFGYTNIETGGNYFPINREASQLARTLGDEKIVSDAINVYNASFNKATRPGAKQSLFIKNVYQVVENHAKGVSAYYGLYVPLKAFNQVYNKRIGTDYKTSLREITKSNFVGANDYIDKLFKDIQGFSAKTDTFSKYFRWMRGNFAKFQLGLNPKTVLGQTSSYLMAGTYLDTSSLAKGLTMKTNTEQMYEYAPFTRYRMEDKSVVKAQTNTIEKMSNGRIAQFGDTLMKPIEWMDNNVVKKLWNACQVQVEKNTGNKIGSEENLKASGKLLEKVVRETQSNSIVSEKTGLARTQNEILSALVMFTSDAQKQLSRIADAVGTNSVIRYKVKTGKLSKDSIEYKKSKQLLGKTLTSYVMATSLFVMIGMIMRWLLSKRDEEKNLAEEFMGDFNSQVVGLIPIARDIYGYITEGYDMNNYATTMVTDLAGATKSLFELASKFIQGKHLTKADIGSPFRKAVYSVSQFAGLPTRNLYNYANGIIGKFSPSTAYRMNSLFYESKMSDLDKAIENNQQGVAKAIIRELYKGRNISVSNDYVNEVYNLYKAGYSVIPSKVNQEFSYNGNEFKLGNTEYKTLVEKAKKAVAINESLLSNKLYQRLSEEAKSKYLKNNYSIRYVQSLADVIGYENLSDSDQNKYLIAKALSDKAIEYMAYIKTIEADKDKEGNAIAGSKKAKVLKFLKSVKLSVAEKYLLMAYAGFKNTNGESQVRSQLRKSGLNATQIDKILKFCGY